MSLFRSCRKVHSTPFITDALTQRLRDRLTSCLECVPGIYAVGFDSNSMNVMGHKTALDALSNNINHIRVNKIVAEAPILADGAMNNYQTFSNHQKRQHFSAELSVKPLSFIGKKGIYAAGYHPFAADAVVLLCHNDVYDIMPDQIGSVKITKIIAEPPMLCSFFVREGLDNNTYIGRSLELSVTVNKAMYGITVGHTLFDGVTKRFPEEEDVTKTVIDNRNKKKDLQEIRFVKLPTDYKNDKLYELDSDKMTDYLFSKQENIDNEMMKAASGLVRGCWITDGVDIGLIQCINDNELPQTQINREHLKQFNNFQVDETYFVKIEDVLQPLQITQLFSFMMHSWGDNKHPVLVRDIAMALNKDNPQQALLWKGDSGRIVYDKHGNAVGMFTGIGHYQSNGLLIYYHIIQNLNFVIRIMDENYW